MPDFVFLPIAGYIRKRRRKVTINFKDDDEQFKECLCREKIDEQKGQVQSVVH